MKKLLTFDQFLLESNFNGKRVCIMPGRYMPVHLGHIASLRKASNEFNCPVIPIQILSKNDKSPFPEYILEKIGKEVVKEFDFIEDFIIFPQNLKTVIPQMVLYLRGLGYEPIGMACGSDREKSYQSQIKYINSDKSDVPVSEPFELKVVDQRKLNGPSGTKVRKAISENNKEEFEEMTPNSIHKFYSELKKYN